MAVVTDGDVARPRDGLEILLPRRPAGDVRHDDVVALIVRIHPDLDGNVLVDRAVVHEAQQVAQGLHLAVGQLQAVPNVHGVPRCPVVLDGARGLGGDVLLHLDELGRLHEVRDRFGAGVGDGTCDGTGGVGCVEAPIEHGGHVLGNGVRPVGQGTAARRVALEARTGRAVVARVDPPCPP